MEPILRPALRGDAAPAGTICYSAFRKIAEEHAFPPDFPAPEAAIGLIDHVLTRANVHAVMAELDGRVVGSNFLWEDDAVAGVGPITVDPAVQNARIGRRLMGAVLERANERGFRSVRLVQAAYHARSLSLYLKLGFRVCEPLSVMQGPALGLRVDGYAVRGATSADLDAANGLCRRVHGHARSRELAAALQQGTVTVVERDGRLTGYASAIGFFGHAVAETNGDLWALIAASPTFAGPGFMVASRNAELMQWCLGHGLRIVQPMTLMAKGWYQEPQGAFLPSVLY